jgi:hypothetical protein
MISSILLSQVQRGLESLGAPSKYLHKFKKYNLRAGIESAFDPNVVSKTTASVKKVCHRARGMRLAS